MTEAPPNYPSAESLGEETSQQPAKLGAPLAAAADPIDRVVRLAPSWTIFALVACALIIAGTGVWAFFGQVTQLLPAPGIIQDSGYQAVTAPTDATVAEILVKSGDEVSAGQSVLSFTNGIVLSSPMDGNVAAVYVTVGSQVPANATMLGVTDYTKPDTAYVLLPPSAVGEVHPNMEVELAISSVPVSTYGYALGRVTEIGDHPLTTAQVAEFLDSEPEIVAYALGSDPGILASIQLQTDTSTTSNYAWTVGSGPDFAPVQGTPVTANIILNVTKPIEVMFRSSSAIVVPNYGN